MEAAASLNLKLEAYPGGVLVARGLRDLAEGTQSEEALLVLVAAPRLRGLGFTVPKLPTVVGLPEHALYLAIESRNPKGAHGEYNSLIGRVVSFAQAYSQVWNSNG